MAEDPRQSRADDDLCKTSSMGDKLTDEEQQSLIPILARILASYSRADDALRSQRPREVARSRAIRLATVATLPAMGFLNHFFGPEAQTRSGSSSFVHPLPTPEQCAEHFGAAMANNWHLKTKPATLHFRDLAKTHVLPFRAEQNTQQAWEDFVVSVFPTAFPTLDVPDLKKQGRELKDLLKSYPNGNGAEDNNIHASLLKKVNVHKVTLPASLANSSSAATASSSLPAEPQPKSGISGSAPVPQPNVGISQLRPWSYREAESYEQQMGAFRKGFEDKSSPSSSHGNLDERSTRVLNMPDREMEQWKEELKNWTISHPFYSLAPDDTCTRQRVLGRVIGRVIKHRRKAASLGHELGSLSPSIILGSVSRQHQKLIGDQPNEAPLSEDEMVDRVLEMAEREVKRVQVLLSACG